MRWSDVTAEHIAAETERVVATASSLRNDAVLAPSLVHGLVARSRALPRGAQRRRARARVHVALTGEPGTMYASQQARDDEIEAGARRPAADQAADILESAERLAPLLAALGPEHADVSVARVPAGPTLSVGRVPFMRLRELVFHHVDLDACFTFDRVDARARRPLPRRGGRAPAHRRRGAVGAAPPRPRDGRCPSSAVVPPLVTGSPSGLLLVGRPRSHRRRGRRRPSTHAALRRLTMTDPARAPVTPPTTTPGP